MKARIYISLKSGVLDPQGRAIHRALESLGFEGVESVRQGKLIELELKDGDPENARARCDDMCRRLLANTVIERYEIEILG
ncbi:MAG: phosphoribosylformylglycinamidine synthase subunit PurS [Rhodothalassiaceae bacterium]